VDVGQGAGPALGPAQTAGTLASARRRRAAHGLRGRALTSAHGGFPEIGRRRYTHKKSHADPEMR
jgi:hypothetical protein